MIDPKFGNTTLVFSASPEGNWEKPDYTAIREEREADQREREYGRLMRERFSVCG